MWAYVSFTRKHHKSNGDFKKYWREYMGSYEKKKKKGGGVGWESEGK